MPPPGPDEKEDGKPSSPPPRARRPGTNHDSGVATKRDMAAATVDEVTADLSKDPRSERDDDGEGQ
jgi:hypothetical protein